MSSVSTRWWTMLVVSTCLEWISSALSLTPPTPFSRLSWFVSNLWNPFYHYVDLAVPFPSFARRHTCLLVYIPLLLHSLEILRLSTVQGKVMVLLLQDFDGYVSNSFDAITLLLCSRIINYYQVCPLSALSSSTYILLLELQSLQTPHDV